MTETPFPYRLLFVEDDVILRENYTHYFQTLFETVYSTGDGEEGYRLYEAHRPDIMILDIELPKLSGLELLKKVRRKDHRTKAIMLTAYSNVDYLLSATELKLTRYLIKPVTQKDLKNALQATIDEIVRFETISKRQLIFKAGYHWDFSQQELIHHAKVIKLTPHETLIMQVLCKQPHITVTNEELMQSIWNDFDRELMSTLRNTVSTLRRKLPDDTLINIYGTGYKLKPL
jgi:two-component system response regulator VanR